MPTPSVGALVVDPRQLVPGNRVRLLRDGAEIFPVWLAAIAGARRRISLEMYIFSDDGIGRRFAEGLCRAAERGVEVRLLYDDVGCRFTPRAFFDGMRARGVMTIAYHRNRRVIPRFGKMFRRNHRKNLVVDGERGFVGGLNISNEWLPRSEGGDDWRDAVVEVAGPAVRVLETIFAGTWNARAHRPWRLSVAAEPLPGVVGSTRLAALTNSERGERFVIRRSLLQAVGACAERIWIANPYFIPDRGLSQALELAASRGREVRVLVPSSSDSRVLDAAARATFPRLLAAGARIWQSPAFIHTKVILVDDAFVSLGSYNLDHRSLAFNLELVVNVLDGELNRAAARMLTAETEASREVTAETLSDLSWLSRLGDRAAFSLRRWL